MPFAGALAGHDARSIYFDSLLHKVRVGGRELKIWICMMATPWSIVAIVCHALVTRTMHAVFWVACVFRWPAYHQVRCGI